MSILQEYLALQKNTEASPHLHRWAFLSCVGAALSRNVWVTHGNHYIYANMYVFFVGIPASRKSSAITSSRDILQGGGFSNFSFGSTSMEQFVADFSEVNMPRKLTGEIDFEAALEMNFNNLTATNVFVCEDEMANFLGAGNGRFIKALTELWDNKPFKDFRYKNSKHVHVDKPTISMLGGFTPTSFVESIPQESSGNGFLSRAILVYAPPIARKIAWPDRPTPEQKQVFNNVFAELIKLSGEAEFANGVKEILAAIYETWESLDDVRLQYYSGRRFEHLLRLCVSLAALEAVEAGRSQVIVTENVVIEANTILTYTEEYMSMAMGELGKSKNSDAAQKIIERLAVANDPVPITDLWISVNQDLEKVSQLHDVINKLKLADKVIVTTQTGSNGMPIAKIALKRKAQKDKMPYVDFKKYLPEVGKTKLRIV